MASSPTLLHRLFFDKEVVNNEYGIPDALPLPKHIYKGGGDEEAAEAPAAEEPEGDAPAMSPAARNIKYGQRMSLYFLLVFASLLVALAIFKSDAFKKAIFKRKSIDDIGEDGKDIPKFKTKMWTYVLLFLSVFAASFLVLWFVGCFLIIMVGLISEDDPYKVAKRVWKHVFIKFNGISIGLHFWVIFLLVILLVPLHYLGYSNFFGGWYDDMFFQDTGKKKEDKQLDSFIHYYGLTILAIFTLFMILLCMKIMMEKGESQLYAYYTMFFFLAYLILCVYMLKEFKRGKYLKLLFILLLVFLIVFVYMFGILLIITMFNLKGPSPIKVMFRKGSGILGTLLFRFGVDSSIVIPSKMKAAKGISLDDIGIRC